MEIFMNDTISFTSRLSIIDPKASGKNRALYDRLAEQFQKQTGNSDFHVQLSRTSRTLDYDKFEVYENADRKDIFNVRCLDKIDQLPDKEAVDILLDLFKISKLRMKYNEIITGKQNEIQQLKDSINQMTQTKKFVTKTKLPSGITYAEYYNV